jgi:DNA modification methylase
MVALSTQQPNIWQEEPIAVKRGDIWQLGEHRLMCGDSTNAEDVARLLLGESVDLVFADPPYGIGIDTWDKAIVDVPAFFTLVTQHLKQGGFFAFTHQMPYMVAWLAALESTPLRYKDHIAWIKRNHTAIACPLLRNHESLFIYGHGKTSYHQTKGRYEDVKLPGVLVDVITLEGIGRYIGDLQRKANGNPSKKTERNIHHSTYRYMGLSGDRSPEHTNFTNVWSFLPENKRTFNKENLVHATGKPTLLMNRLLELTTPEHATVYDAFLGSGTTLISGETTNRTVLGMELSETYCSAIITRWQALTGRKAVQV